jgi:L-iditol 2-dehydrogenase
MSGGEAAASPTMRALVLHGVGDARVEEIPRPAAREGEILVRVGFCGVCGSDIPRVFVKGTYSFPTVCGHEFAGTVAARGPGVGELEVGEPVTVFPLLWCGRCPACEEGKYAQCHDYDYLGSRSDGAFAEYVAAPRRNVLRVPEGVSLEQAAMTEPAAVALHAVRRAGGAHPGDAVAVFGAGPIGLLVAQWARAMGAGPVVLFDIVGEKLALARRLGFSHTHDSGRDDPPAVLASLTGGQGVHLSVEAAGVPATLVAALAAARRGGRVVLLGNPSSDARLPAGLLSQLMRREVGFFGSWNSDYSTSGGGDDDWRAALRAMASGKIDVLPLVTHRVPLERSFEAMQMMRDGREFFAKVLVHP